MGTPQPAKPTNAYPPELDTAPANGLPETAVNAARHVLRARDEEVPTVNAQALICDAQRQFALREVTLPDPGPHDLVIRTLWSGVSIGTEFMMVRTTLDRVFYPLCTGYTATGVVEAAGAEVAGYTAGDLVYFRTSPGMMLDGEPVCIPPAARTPATR